MSKKYVHELLGALVYFKEDTPYMEREKGPTTIWFDGRMHWGYCNFSKAIFNNGEIRLSYYGNKPHKIILRNGQVSS